MNIKKIAPACSIFAYQNCCVHFCTWKILKIRDLAGFNPDPNQIDLRISTDAHKLVSCRADKPYIGTANGTKWCSYTTK